MAKNLLAPFPRLSKLWQAGSARLQGMPPVAHSKITKELIRECVGKEDPTILDIGSNDGSHGLWFFEIFKNPKVYCFEPDPRAIARFKANVGDRPNIKLFEMALCDRVGEIAFYQSSGQRNEGEAQHMPEGWDLSGSIRQPKQHLVVHPWVKFEQKVTVAASTLDTWCAEQGIGPIDFIWMDVQGAEMDVFKGGTKALTKTRFLYTEYSNQELYQGQVHLKNLMKYLETFQVLVRYPGDVLFRHMQLTEVPSKALQQMLDDAHR